MKSKASIILAIVVMLMGQHVFCQTDQENTYLRTVGMDANFINNFLPIDNSIGTRGTYLLHYIGYNEDGKFTKHAFDMSIGGTFESNDSDIDQDNFRFDIEYKIGRGKRKSAFNNKAYFLFGGELAVRYFTNKRSIVDPNDPTGLGLNKNLDRLFATSIGPVLGFGYNILKRFSIYTEAGLNFRVGYGIDNFESEFDPSLNFRDNVLSLTTGFLIPRSLIIFYHF